MSMIIYTCPKCGADLEEIVLCSYPPQYEKRCPKCGYSYTEKADIIRIPYVEPTPLKFVEPAPLEQPYKISCTDVISDACESCVNNPKNGGSGICHCILGTQVTY